MSTHHNFPLDLFKEQSTPFYYYDLHLLDRTLEELKKASSIPGYHVHYALKANANPEILTRIAGAGLGADTVSGAEIEAALRSGFPASRIVYAGVGKTDAEIELALRAGISCFNVESDAELAVIEEIARRLGLVAPVALRVNPEIDAHTHHYITTGLAENKFGIAMTHLAAMIERARSSDVINFRGLHFHIGSQITDLAPFGLLCDRINALQDEYNARGIHFDTINVGGGLGIDYVDPDAHPVADFTSYFATFHRRLRLRPGQELHFELGRAIVAQCGSLISRVIYVKEGVSRRFAIIDAGMSDLIRPALYQAHHKIENLTGHGADETYDVVGPICESSDVFGTDERLPKVERGDIFALRSAGAYGEVMASRYNLRSLPHIVVSQ